MEDLTLDFINAKSNGLWNDHKIDTVLNSVLLKYPSLKIDHDKSAGEEWVRAYDDNYGIVFMMHCKIKIIFVKKIDLSFLKKILVINVSDFNDAKWKINLNMIAEACPELCWEASTDAIDPDRLTLLDIYYASV